MANWKIRLAENEGREGVTAESNDIHSALEAAWQLQRHYECPVEIVDLRDDEQRVAALVYVEWLD